MHDFNGYSLSAFMFFQPHAWDVFSDHIDYAISWYVSRVHCSPAQTECTATVTQMHILGWHAHTICSTNNAQTGDNYVKDGRIDGQSATGCHCTIQHSQGWGSCLLCR